MDQKNTGDSQLLTIHKLMLFCFFSDFQPAKFLPEAGWDSLVDPLFPARSSRGSPRKRLACDVFYHLWMWMRQMKIYMMKFGWHVIFIDMLVKIFTDSSQNVITFMINIYYCNMELSIKTWSTKLLFQHPFFGPMGWNRWIAQGIKLLLGHVSWHRGFHRGNPSHPLPERLDASCAKK